MIVVTYLVVYWISVMSRWLDNVAAYIPRPPTLTSDEEKQLNKELQSAIVFSFNLIAANTAKLDFLRTLEPQVRSLNFFKLWHDVFTWIHELKIVVEQSAFWGGLSFGLFAVVATWVGLYFATSRIMQEIRQGKLRKMKEETSLIVADRYVGLHCMHFVVTFVSVFFIVFVIAVLLSSPKLLMEILKNTYKALLTSLATVIISTLFEKLVVGVWWVNGLTIFLMHPYFLWTVISVIMSLVNGVIETIVRWFEAIFSITVLFARLDMDLFPKALLWLDMGYWAYYSMLFVDEEYNNPIFLTAASCFLTELLIHREFKAGVQSKPTQFGGAEVIQLPHIRNILRIRLRAMMGESTDLSEKCRSDSYAWDLHLMDAVSLRKRRVANRWKASRLTADRRQPFFPFYAANDLSRNPGHRSYYLLRRQPHRLSSRSREHGARSSYLGHDVFVSLVDADQAPLNASLRQLGLDLLCTNRDLTMAMPIGKRNTDFTIVINAPVASIRCVVGPTLPRPCRGDGDYAWRFISHLGLNYLTLTDNGDVQGAAALRELLRLYVPGGATLASRQLDALLSVASTPIVRRIPGAGPVCAGRGLQVTVTVEETPFAGGSAILLGAVLDRFFAKYVSINGFTETVLRSPDRGEVMRWPMQLGLRPLL